MRIEVSLYRKTSIQRLPGVRKVPGIGQYKENGSITQEYVLRASLNSPHRME